MRPLFILLLLSFSTALAAQLNATLRSQLDYDQSVTDIWGYAAPDGTEYAIVTTESGTSFVSLVNPDNPEEVAFISGDFSMWRDAKTYGEYAYTVADQGAQGITAFDLRFLPDSVPFKRTTYQIPVFNRTFLQAHNLYVDDKAGRLYTAGGDRRINDGGILIFDLNDDPLTPTYVGAAPETYSHDIYVKDDTLYCSEIYDGELAMYDISDLDNIKTLGTTLTPFTFTHNAWTTDDGQHIFTTDEEPDAPVAAYDISDKSDIKKTFEFRPLNTIGTGVIPHNVHVIDDFLSISYYTDGLIVADASKPDNIIEVANWDTWLGPDGDFNGAWGAYPFLPSGLTLVSDRQSGLFVIDVDYKRAARLEGTITDAATGQPLNNVRVEIETNQTNGVNSDALGAYKTGIADGGTYTVTIVAENYNPIIVEKNLINGDCLILDTTMTKSQLLDLDLSIVDDATGAPIPDAQFVLTNIFRSFPLRSNADGKVAFSTQYDANYELIVTQWGYQTIAETGINPEDLVGQEIRLSRGYMDDFVTDEGWTVSGEVASGAWERAVPVGTVFRGAAINPGFDATGDIGKECYVTGNIGGDPRTGDVDNGITILTSPAFGPLPRLKDLQVSYQYWLANAGADPINDTLVISITNGITTAIVREYALAEQGASGWVADSFRVDEYVEVNGDLQLIVTTSDLATSGHLVEGGFDNFLVSGQEVPVSADNVVANGLTAKVFPNPSANAFTLNFTGITVAQPTLRISDALGRIVTTQAFNGESVRFGETLPTGLYFAELLDGKQRLYVTKIVKE